MCAQVANHVAGRCVEILGGVGFIKDFPTEKFFRDAKIGELGILSFEYGWISRLCLVMQDKSTRGLLISS